MLLAASIPVLYLLQTLTPDGGLSLAFRPSTLTDGGWWPGVLTSMGLHAGWTHALINAAFAFAFGPPVARLFPGLRGAAVFFAYYIVCGLIGTLGFGLMHLHGETPMVGASGAVTGLLGGAIRLLGAGGGLKPLRDRSVLTTSAVILGLNLVTGLVGYTPGVESAGRRLSGVAAADRAVVQGVRWGARPAGADGRRGRCAALDGALGRLDSP